MKGTRGSVVGWGTMLQAAKSRFRFPMRSLDFFNWLNPSTRTTVVGSTQPLTEMNTRNLPGELNGGRRITVITSLPSVNRLSKKYGILDVLTTLWASTACYRDSFTFYWHYREITQKNSGRNVRLTTQFNLLLTWTLLGAVTSLPHKSSRRGV
jgi:hypothetical protein